jgi:branched-subunit amino acid transport protein
MTPALAWGLVAGMAITNIVVRGAPMLVMSRLRLPSAVERWLGYIPVSVMAAIVAVQVLKPDGRYLPLAHNPYLFATLPTAVVYRYTRSFLGAVLVGIASFVALRYLLG